MSNLITIVAEAVFLYGWRPATNVQRSSSSSSSSHEGGREELHLFRCQSAPLAVQNSLRAAAGQFGYVPRRSSAGYVRKGTNQNWAGWVWQEPEDGACTWWTALNLPTGYYEIKFYQAL